ncbi:aldehyde dehydrogenase family protein [Streptomyces sp. NPDC092129]|uniref:aldehyde dehydrogenase family protein n=1 Tax=Streptomyces sp. NPDC092129 TaxID=3366010 RepID=UPI0037F93529
MRSPHDNSLVGHAAQAAPADVDAAVATARKAFDKGPWPTMRPEERRALVARLDELHAARASEIAALITAENGTPAWFTQSLQTAVSEQTAEYLRAADRFGWEDALALPCPREEDGR